MKRKREHVLDNPSKKNKTDKIIDEIKTKKLLIKDFLPKIPIEFKRHGVFRRSKLKTGHIKYLIKKTNGECNISDENIKYLKKILKEYIGMIVEKTKNLMVSKNKDCRTILPGEINEVINFCIKENNDFLLKK